MPDLELVGPTYEDESLTADAQKTQNLYPESNDSRDVGGSAKISLYPTPGKELLVAMGGGPGACIVPADTFVFPDGVTAAYFAVNGETLSYITVVVGGPAGYTGTEHVIGTVSQNVILNTGGQLFPAQILVISPTYLFVVANGQAFVAAYGSPIATTVLNQGGGSYAVGDTGIVVGGEIDAQYEVLTVDVNGAVLTYSITYTGTGYSVGTDQPTIGAGTQPGIGTGFTIDIDSVGASAWLIQRQSIPSSDTAFNNYVNSATFTDGYIICSMAPNSADPLRRQFFVSGLNDASFWSPLEFGEKAGNPDPIVAVFAAYELLMLFGTQTTEPWYDTGNLTFQFQRIAGGGVIENGLASPWACQKMDGTIVWLGTDIRGANVAWQLQGLTPARISNHALENAWRQYDVSGASCYSYQENGHFFCVFNFPIPDVTWVYDSVTRMWHERASADGGGNLHADYGRYHAFAQNVGHALQDYNNGNVYLSQVGFFQENGSNISRLRRTPHFRTELARVVYDRARLLVDQGGLNAGTGAVISLRLSDDGGNTWGPYLSITAGAVGNFTELIQWFHLGYCRDRVFEISSNTPVFQAWIEGYVEYRRAVNHD